MIRRPRFITNRYQGMKTVSATARNKAKPRTANSRRKNMLASRWEGRSAFVAAGLLVAAVFVCYANALGNDFVFDDNSQVLTNKLLRSISNIPLLLTVSYRPLRDISYALDFAIWGDGPFGFHLTNILIHAGNTLLVFLIVRRLTGAVITAALVGVVFAVHPLQPDAVTYISGRRDILFSLFYLTSFYSYLNYRRRGSWAYFASFLICWGLSLMSKEMAVSLPAFIFVWRFCDLWSEQSGPWLKRCWRAARSAFISDKWLYITLALVVPAYAYYMIFIRGGSTRAGITGLEYWGGSFVTNALTVVTVHAWYLKQLVFPTPIVQYLGAFEIATTLFDVRVILSIIVVCSVLLAGFVLLNRNKLMAFAILSYFTLLLPVSQIIPHHELLADHYLYLPLMSFSLFAALLVQEIAARSEGAKKIAYGFAVAAVIVLASLTVVRNKDWKDEFTLWQANHKEVPNSIRAVGNLATMYAGRNPNRAVELYRRCLELDPTYAPAYIGLATLLQAKEKAHEVEELVQKRLAMPESKGISPGLEDPTIGRAQLITALAIAKRNQGETEEAKKLLLDAINLNPLEPRPYTLLAVWYHDEDPEKELEILGRQLAANPGDYKPLQSISYRLLELKRYDEALPYLERLIAINPNDFNANFHLGEIYLTRKDCQHARAFFNAAQSAASKPEQINIVDAGIRGLVQQCGGP